MNNKTGKDEHDLKSLSFSSSHRMCSIKMVLKYFGKFTGKDLCRRLFFDMTAALLKQAPTQVLYCAFCKIFKNTYFQEHLWEAASDH